MIALALSFNFTLSGRHFLKDGVEFQIMAGELYPSRIYEYDWLQSIKMVKALGLNTVCMTVFWNVHEIDIEKFDFATPQNNISNFLRMCSWEGLYVLVKPGPVVLCGYDFGGLPARYENSTYTRIRYHELGGFAEEAALYLKALAHEIAPFMSYNNGPILMIQLEDLYGQWEFYDKRYLEYLKKVFVDNKITGPFFTNDFAPNMNRYTHVVGAAIGLAGHVRYDQFQAAVTATYDSYVPCLASQLLTGVSGFWNGSWNSTGYNIDGYISQYLDANVSFIISPVQGGTNYGLQAGTMTAGHGINALMTSYDSSAPITEWGAPGHRYEYYRRTIAQKTGVEAPPIPAPIPTTITPTIQLQRVGGVVDQALPELKDEWPLSYAAMQYNQGIVFYETLLPPGAGTLEFGKINGFCDVYVNKSLLASQLNWGMYKIVVPAPSKSPVSLYVVCDAYGHLIPEQTKINDEKGIAANLSVHGKNISLWSMRRFNLSRFPTNIVKEDKWPHLKGGVYYGTFTLNTTGATFFDMTAYTRGYLFVNGFNLGRYWELGPQRRLYCPRAYLKQGDNEIYVIDLEYSTAAKVSGFPWPV